MRGFKLRFLSPVHLGSSGWGREEVETVLHSDTLFSALMHASMKLRGQPIGDILVSSAFPFIGDDLFFPKPLLPLPSAAAGGDRDASRRALSALSLVNQESFIRWTSSETVDVERVLHFESLLQGDGMLRAHVATGLRARVAVDRQTSASALYYVGATSYSGESGLFCLLDGTANECDLALDLLTFLGEEGVGGQRSAGYGRFRVEPFEWMPPSVAVPVSYVSLGLINPAPGEEGALKAYRLVNRGGWIESEQGATGLRRRRVAMALEGAIVDRRIDGRVVDVTPDSWTGHRILRYGRAFLLGASVSA